MKRALILVLALATVAAASAAAQGRERDGPPGRGMRGPAFAGGALGGMRFYDPGFLLRRQSDLGLTEAQIEQLTRLNTEAVTTREQARIAVVSQRAQLAEALAASDPDIQVARAHFDSAQVAMSNLQWAAISTASQARTVLTEEQRVTVRDLRPERARGRPGRLQRRRR